ncbi:hypothetical protein PIROE2DRAFT_9372 [Piromyces sp. E2]|nr:hypothetical protein PIROE2DRAFT_9372 [Piromyces sp. E2]|eukprot:OUM63987.1 hypothetical protein PIROE2DRAFT_9372 [Piromyces sp. E2]
MKYRSKLSINNIIVVYTCKLNFGATECPLTRLLTKWATREAGNRAAKTTRLLPDEICFFFKKIN